MRLAEVAQRLQNNSFLNTVLSYGRLNDYLLLHALDHDIKLAVTSTPNRYTVLPSEIVPPSEIFRNGVRMNIREFIRIHEQNSIPGIPELNTAEVITESMMPFMSFLMDEIEALEQKRGRTSHFIRSSSVADILLAKTSFQPTENSVPIARRGELKSIIANDHPHERFPLGTLLDRVKQQLHTGSDLDLKIEFSDYHSFFEYLRQTLPSYDENLELLVNNEDDKGGMFIWHLKGKQITAGARYDEGPILPHELYLRCRHTSTRSGIPRIEVDLIHGENFDGKELEIRQHDLNILFSIGFSQYESLTEEVRARDTRVSRIANKWDQKGRGRLVRENEDIYLAAEKESVAALASPNEVGEEIDSLREYRPILFFDETLRIFRKAVVEKRNLEFSREGRTHMTPDFNSSTSSRFWRDHGYYFPITDDSLTYINSVLRNPDFFENFHIAWNELESERKMFFSTIFASEIMTMLFYAPKETFTLLRDFGYTEFFPFLKGLSERPDIYNTVIEELPDQRELELTTLLRMDWYNALTKRVQPLLNSSQYRRNALHIGASIMHSDESIFHSTPYIIDNLCLTPRMLRIRKVLEKMAELTSSFSPTTIVPTGFSSMVRLVTIDPSLYPQGYPTWLRDVITPIRDTSLR